MLRHTFCHIPGVGERTEEGLWQAGITSWDILLDTPKTRTVPAARRLGTTPLRDSLHHYEQHNPRWFAERLPSGQVWRLFHDFRASCAYLDIETTGMSAGDHITTIALYDGRAVRHYVRGQNLDDFVRDIQSYRLLVTYNGKSFDVPFIERGLGCRLAQAHIDLRHVLKGLGYTGGLKRCEKQLGVQRPGMEELDGYVAVLLWHDFTRRRNDRALETLLAYNVQDAVNLETLMVLAYNRKLAELAHVSFASGYRLALPALPANPFRVDPATVRRVLAANPWAGPYWR